MAAAIEDRFGSAVGVRSNEPTVLRANPEHEVNGKLVRWRIGAFEVIDEDSGSVLFSKLQLGRYASPKGDGSRPEDEERVARSTMQVLLDDIEDRLEDKQDTETAT